MSLSRRRFIGLAGGMAGAAAISGSLGCTNTTTDAISVPEAARSARSGSVPTSMSSPLEDRVLVVLQMSGGNDGLNTLVPTSDGRYRDLRPSLALAEEELILLPGASGYALHPALAPLAALWGQGRLAALTAVGIPGQSRSHFAALDRWWGAGVGGSATGWIGSWLDATAGDPNPMRAVGLGGGSPALNGQRTSPLTVQSLGGFQLVGPGRNDAAARFGALGSSDEAGLLGAAQAAIPVALETVDQLAGVFNGLGSSSFRAGSAAELLDAAAAIIAADLGTRVVVVNVGGFDTHAAQLWRHATLLGDVGMGVAAMFDRLDASGHADRTLLMTFSEFGRRAAENASGGTDHGRAGLALLAGPGVKESTVIGEADLGQLVDGDVAISIDGRSLHVNALDWLGGPGSSVLAGEWDSHDLVSVG